MARSCCSRWASGPKLSHWPAVDSRNQRGRPHTGEVIELAGQRSLHAAVLRVRGAGDCTSTPPSFDVPECGHQREDDGVHGGGGAGSQRSAAGRDEAQTPWPLHRSTSATRSRSDGRHRKTSIPGHARSSAEPALLVLGDLARLRLQLGEDEPGWADERQVRPAALRPLRRAPGGRRASGRASRARRTCRWKSFSAMRTALGGSRWRPRKQSCGSVRRQRFVMRPRSRALTAAVPSARCASARAAGRPGRPPGRRRRPRRR